MPTPHAMSVLGLMMVAKAVAVVPTCTERLLGRTDATRPGTASRASAGGSTGPCGSHAPVENVTDRLSKRAKAWGDPPANRAPRIAVASAQSGPVAPADEDTEPIWAPAASN